MSDVIQSTTQQFLDIYDITNNYVIMKNGTVSTIMTVDAMNFGLLAEEEQDAIMYAYAGLLNSLNYPIQIIINSQTKDVTTYLKLLQDQEAEAENETLRHRIRMYREFVGNLIHERNVLDKKFYVVIPASALEMGIVGAKSVLPGKDTFDISSIERSVIIEKAQNLLDPKKDHLIAQFARIGLYSRQLTTQEIIQLFYIRYNPEATEGQQIGESRSYTTPLVKASIQGNFMNAPAAPAPLPQTPEQFPAASGQVAPLPEIHVAPVEQTPAASEMFTPETVSSVVQEQITQPIAEQPTFSPAPVQAAPETVVTETIQTTEPVIADTVTEPETAHTLTSAVTVPATVEATQEDLDATIQSLGGAIASPATNPDLPPLPEI